MKQDRAALARIIEELSRLTKAVETLVPRSPAAFYPIATRFSYFDSVGLSYELAARYEDLIDQHARMLAWEDNKGREVDGRIRIERRHIEAGAILAARELAGE